MASCIRVARTLAICYAIFERSGLRVRSWRRLADAEKLALCDAFNVEPV